MRTNQQNLLQSRQFLISRNAFTRLCKMTGSILFENVKKTLYGVGNDSLYLTLTQHFYIEHDFFKERRNLTSPI